MTPPLFDVDGLPAPLPGTSSPQAALFVDRWGTLLELPTKNNSAAFKDIQFTEGALDALFRATQAGWTLYLVGNEDLVSTGKVSDKAWIKFEAELLSTMQAKGVRVAHSYACLDHPEKGKGAHQRDSVFLLPNTGPMYHARQHDGIHLPTSWVIGDSTLELASGWRAGCRTASVKSGLAAADGEVEIDVEFQGENLAAVLDEIMQLAAAANN
ncbi:MAG: mannose-1-phosphate guanylyltransferase/phosphomannomutase [Planctomycetota bacterium]|jgi:mannose-1-phosphate guanylyltransferase/phosphomannomutase